jgi:hypothetical protein
MTRPYDLQAEQRREPLGLGEPRPRLSWKLESDRQGAARDAGMRIPTDLSVVGFDDLPVTALTDPPLTTVHQPLVEMAMAATELALALGRGENHHSSDSSSPPP